MKTAAIILAAGSSKRLGFPKQLVDFNGLKLIEHSVKAALEANCHPVYVVLGAQKEKILPVIQKYSIEIIENNHWEEGIASSIGVGIEHIMKQAEVEAAILLLSDQPFVSAFLLRSLILKLIESNYSIVASTYAQTKGVPAIFQSNIFQELTELQGNEGAKKVILSEGREVGEVEFPEGVIDIDTPEDLKKLY